MGAAVAFQKLLQHTLIAIMLSITPTCAALFYINIPFVSQRRRRGNVLCEKKRKASGWVGFKRVNLNKLKKLLTKDSFFLVVHTMLVHNAFEGCCCVMSVLVIVNF